MNTQFLANTTQISYSPEKSEKKSFETIEEIRLMDEPNTIKWLNTYGLSYRSTFKEVVRQNKMEDFLIKLLNDDDHSNKVIDMDDVLFVALRVIKPENSDFDDEMMLFIASSKFVWSIQEKPGDHFGWIRERIANDKGIVRKKKADYLLFLIVESIIDNYQSSYLNKAGLKIEELNVNNKKPTPQFTAQIEQLKQQLFKYQRSALSLRDTIMKLEKVQLKGTRTNYFSELKEQVNNLISDIDFDLHELESKINLLFSIQGHRLNEVMRTLTVFSVVFIPLTFIVGIYGMNFKYMPELEAKNGYFILLGVMAFITLLTFFVIWRKKWF